MKLGRFLLARLSPVWASALFLLASHTYAAPPSERASGDAAKSASENPTRAKAALMASIDAHVAPLIASGLTPGAVVGISVDGESTFRGYGSIGLNGQSPPNERTVYEIGSISKVFTGILLAESVRRGEATLDTSIVRWMPKEVRGARDDLKDLKLWHLSSHASGLPRMPDNFVAAEGGDPYANYTEDVLWDGMKTCRLRRKPEAGYEYSNLGAGLLGVLLERATKKSYGELLAERIADPLELRDTTLTLNDDQES